MLTTTLQTDRSPLLQACFVGDAVTAEALLDLGVDPDAEFEVSQQATGFEPSTRLLSC